MFLLLFLLLSFEFVALLYLCVPYNEYVGIFYSFYSHIKKRPTPKLNFDPIKNESEDAIFEDNDIYLSNDKGGNSNNDDSNNSNSNSNNRSSGGSSSNNNNKDTKSLTSSYGRYGDVTI